MVCLNSYADMKKDRWSEEPNRGSRGPALIGVILPTMSTPQTGRKTTREVDHEQTPWYEGAPQMGGGKRVVGSQDEQLALLGSKEALFETKIKAERPQTFNLVEVTLPMPTRFYMDTSTEKPPAQTPVVVIPRTPSTPLAQKKLLSRRIIYLNDNVPTDGNCK